MLNTSLPERFRAILPNLDEIAIQTQLIQRRSAKFSAEAFLCSLLDSLSSAKLSLNQIASRLEERTGHAMSAQGLSERLNNKAEAFLKAVHVELLSHSFKGADNLLLRGLVRRLVIEDSTTLTLPVEQADSFSGCGYKNNQTAGVKIDFAFDLMNGEIISQTLNEARSSDHCLRKEALNELKAGDLVLRDMGYFSFSQLGRINDASAYYVTRIPPKVRIFFKDGQEMETLLSKTRLNQIDCIVTLSNGHKARLIGCRATHTKRNQKQRLRRTTAKRKNREVSQRGLLFDGWNLALTNLRESQAAALEIMALYRARWAVEIAFRAWKQGFQLAALQKHRTGEGHMKVLLYTAMIAHQLMMIKSSNLLGCANHPRLSLEKFCHWVSSKFTKIRNLSEFLAANPDPRHVTGQKRKRKTLRESTLEALT